ncbi:MAG: transglutaminase family protein [Gammaproteobacteria bacterium]
MSRTTVAAWVSGASIAFWGWQVGQLWPALAIAVAIEAARFVPLRWDLQDRDFNRIADLSSVAFVALSAYQFNERAVHAIYAILALVPFVLAPLVLAQVYCVRGTVRLSALVASLRVPPGAPARREDRDIDLRQGFAFACVICACSGGAEPWYFAGAALLTAALLWPQRPRGRRPWIWALTLLAAVGLGFAAQAGIRRLQYLVEDMAFDWLPDRFQADTDPDRAMTAIGDVGRLKLSDRIRIRVRADDGAPLPVPLTLREAAYDRFEFGAWRATYPYQERIDAVPGTHTWAFGARDATTRSATISVSFSRERGVVPAPVGLRALRADTGIELRRNVYGAMTLEHPAGLVRMHAAFDPGAFEQTAPTAQDLAVPGAYRRDFERIAAEIGLADLAPDAAAARIRHWFAQHFRYSLVQRGRYAWRMPLTDFLLRARAGHCEYFASATVLLARTAGIPARYAVGYVIDEWSALERQYVARARDAHAWAEVWIGGRWRMLDTTPAQWAALEDAQASPTMLWKDLVAWAGYQIDRLRSGEAGVRAHAPWIGAALALYLYVRLRHRRRIRAPRTAAAAAAGDDSAFAQLVRRLSRERVALRAGEPLGTWCRRMMHTPGIRPPPPGLPRLLALYYRARFDPVGLPDPLREQLIRDSAGILRELD